jgi:2'-5' RNA ligase
VSRGWSRREGGRDRFVPDEDDPAKPRLFFAVPVPEATKRVVGDLMAGVQASVGDGNAKIRWVRVEGLHLTLRFLGPTPLGRVPTLHEALRSVARSHAPFRVTLSGAGSFPDATRPRTLWLGIEEGADALASLATELTSLATTGADPLSTKPFAPHLTIARTDGLRAGGTAAASLREAAENLDETFTVDRVVLYRSILGSGPASYEPVAEASLEG